MSRSASTPTSTPPRRRFARTRWLYQDQGRDVGPYRPDEVGELLSQRTIDENTLVRETTSQQWKKLGTIPEFGAIVAEAAQVRVARAKEKEFDQKVSAARNKRRLPILLGGFVILVGAGVGGWYGWQQYKAGDVPPGSGYTGDLLRPLTLRDIPARAYLDASGPIAWAEENVEIRESTKDARLRPKTNGGTRRNGATRANTGRGFNDLDPEAPSGEVRELSFEDDTPSVGRELNQGDIMKVRNISAGRLVRCAQNQVASDSSWPGTSVRFKILNSGKMGGISFGANGKRKPSFVSCVKQALGGISVPAFDGPGRTLTVPLKVGR